jgi:photosystem II stability/assembly factor-like uncharacterized protein
MQTKFFHKRLMSIVQSVAITAVLALTSASDGYASVPPPLAHANQSIVIGRGGKQVLLNSDGLFRSVDSGKSWVPISVIQTIPLTRLEKGENDALYVTRNDSQHSDVYYSPDFGATWTRTGAVHGYHAIANDGTLYDCGDDAIGISRDHGATWQRLNKRLPSPKTTCRGLYVGAGEIYVMKHNLYRSTDQGRHWRRVNRKRVSEVFPRPTNFEVAPGVASVKLFIDSHGVLYSFGVPKWTPQGGDRPPSPRTYRSRDHGVTWTRLLPHSSATDTDCGLTFLRADSPIFVCWPATSTEQLPVTVSTLGNDDSIIPLGMRIDTSISEYGWSSGLVLGADNQFYLLQNAWVSRWDADQNAWQRLPLTGIPDFQTGRPR